MSPSLDFELGALNFLRNLDFSLVTPAKKSRREARGLSADLDVGVQNLYCSHGFARRWLSDPASCLIEIGRVTTIYNPGLHADISST